MSNIYGYCDDIWNYYMDVRDGKTSDPPPVVSGVTKADTDAIDRIYDKRERKVQAMYRWFDWSLEVKEDGGGCTDFEGRVWAVSAFEAHDKVWKNIKMKYDWVREENVDLFEVVHLDEDMIEDFVVNKVKHFDKDGMG